MGTEQRTRHEGVTHAEGTPPCVCVCVCRRAPERARAVPDWPSPDPLPSCDATASASLEGDVTAATGSGGGGAAARHRRRTAVCYPPSFGERVVRLTIISRSRDPRDPCLRTRFVTIFFCRRRRSSCSLPRRRRFLGPCSTGR